MSALGGSKNRDLQRLREDLSQCNKKNKHYRHHKSQKGLETQKWKCGDIQTSKCVLFCACNLKLTLFLKISPSHQRGHSKLSFGKLEEKDFYHLRALSIGLYFAVTVLSSHFYPGALKMYLLGWSVSFRLVFFDVCPTHGQAFSTKWPLAGMGLVLGGHKLQRRFLFS